jgi:hypothetical protein
MLRPITSASRVPAQRRCSRLGRCALLLHESSGDPDVRHGCFNLWRRIGLLKMCQCCAQVGLGAVECRQTCLFELETQVTGTRGCRLALLIHPPVGAVCVGLDPTCFLGIRHTDPRWFVC